jgi:pimeloyl-ACP methyl ester carboxylesterase
MAFVTGNGIRISYERSGRGEPVLLIMGSGASGRVWTIHQTPALHQAGYSTVVFDNRGIAPTDAPPGPYTLAEMTADTIALIEALELGPCRLLGTSLGSIIAEQVCLERPDLVVSAVLLATRARSDALRTALNLADRALRASGIELPPEYAAARSVVEMLSPATLNDDSAVRQWLDLFELARGRTEEQAAADELGDRREALRGITVPCRAVAFTDDLICPPHLVAEVADAIPDCDLVEIPRAGHLGNLERPEAVNTAITEFFAKN